MTNLRAATTTMNRQLTDDPNEPRRPWVRKLGPYRQDTHGVWFVELTRPGFERVSVTSCRGLRSYLMCNLARRYGRKSFVFEGKEHRA